VPGQETPDYKRPWQLPRGRHGLPRETVTRSQRERLIAAIVRVSAAKGYEATSVADVLEASGVGRATFYELFEDKEQCFLAAYHVLIDDLFARTEEAYRRPGPWPERVRNGIAAMLDWFAADPEIARVTMLEVIKVGPAIRRIFGETLDRFTALLGERDEVGDSASDLPNLAGIVTGTIFARLYEEVALERSTELPRLLPHFTYEVLAPFLGAEAAREEEARARGALSS
jgi:AcrR family transcriptional regulator